jgi:hypothetical protein
LIEQAARVVRHWQRRIAAARKTHTEKTTRKLQEMGIKLNELRRCEWPDPAQ